MTELITNSNIVMLKKFNNTLASRRLIKEIEDIKLVYSSLTVNYTVESDTLSIKIFNVIEKEPDIIITIIINKNHPFKEPIVLINSETYKSYLTLKDEASINVLHNHFGIKCCFGCTSYTDEKNWSASITLNNIIKEIRNNFEILDKIKVIKNQLNNGKFEDIIQNSYAIQNEEIQNEEITQV